MTNRPLLLSALLVLLVGCYDADSLLIGVDSDAILAELSAGSFATTTNSLIPGALDPMNDPRTIDEDAVMRFDGLPLRAELDRVPWTDTYWPRNRGGITWRWQDDESHTYRWWSRDEVLAATPEQIARLSPAEKYDVFVGAYDYPLAERERARNPASESGWTGYCHGWSTAAMAYDEPGPVTVTSVDGVEVRFGSSDVKALLTYFQGEVISSPYYVGVLDFVVARRGVGTTCSSENLRSSECHDVNPGALHVALANRIGLQGLGVVLEADPGYERWNQPTFAYDATVLHSRTPSPGASEEATEELVVVNDVSWTVEIDPAWHALGAANGDHVETRRYLYTVELDAERQVVGGQWLLRTDDGAFWTMGAVWDWLKAWDEQSLTEDEISELIRGWINLPDVLWVQDEGEFPEEFVAVDTSWSLLGGGVGTRRELYGYMGALPDLLD
jgi:hypothetical protein